MFWLVSARNKPVTIQNIRFAVSDRLEENRRLAPKRSAGVANGQVILNLPLKKTPAQNIIFCLFTEFIKRTRAVVLLVRGAKKIFALRPSH